MALGARHPMPSALLTANRATVAKPVRFTTTLQEQTRATLCGLPAKASRRAVATAPGNVVTDADLREVWGGFREDPGCIAAGMGDRGSVWSAGQARPRLRSRGGARHSVTAVAAP